MFHIVKRGLLVFLFCLYPQIASADYGETFLYVGCNQESKTFELEPLVVWNDQLDDITPTVERGGNMIDQNGYKLFRMEGRKSIDVNCSIDNTTIRVVLPDRSEQLELYENDKLVTSFDIDKLMSMYEVRFKPTSKWEEFCAIDESYCHEIDWNTKRKQLDVREFSPLSKFVYNDKPMIYQTLVSTDDVCKVALKKINDAFLGKQGEYSDLPRVRGQLDLEYSNFDDPSSFDFNNDGNTDKVFSTSGSGSYLRGDIFYVAYGDENSTTKSRLTVTDVYIFPCQFDPSVKTSSSCPTISQDADEAGIKVSFGEDQESVFFRGRYTRMWPIEYNNKTYIILHSSSQNTELYSAVIYPFEKTKFNSVCLFKRQP